MAAGLRRWLATASTVLVGLQGVTGGAAAQPTDPGALAEAPGTVWAAASFALVLVVGGLLLYRYGGFVERSVEASMDRPYVAVVYGLMAFGFVAFAGGYAASQLAQVGGAGGTLSMAALGLAGLVAVGLAGLGFLVVGTLLTEVQGPRRPWHGLVLGAGISAVGWLLLPLLGGLAAWVLLAAFGIGGRTREWFHTPRRVERAGED
jgi:hypothetical protein